MDVLASTVNILVDVVTLEVNITTRSTSTNSEFIEDDYDFQIKLWDLHIVLFRRKNVWDVTSHPGYFGKNGMRVFNLKKNSHFCPTINVEKVWSLVPEASRLHYAKNQDRVPVIDVTKAVSHPLYLHFYIFWSRSWSSSHQAKNRDIDIDVYIGYLQGPWNWKAARPAPRCQGQVFQPKGRAKDPGQRWTMHSDCLSIESNKFGKGGRIKCLFYFSFFLNFPGVFCLFSCSFRFDCE